LTNAEILQRQADRNTRLAECSEHPADRAHYYQQADLYTRCANACRADLGDPYNGSTLSVVHYGRPPRVEILS
jgi:hypothetical protein